MRTRFVAEIIAGPRARDPLNPDQPAARFDGAARAGSFVEVEMREGVAHPVREIAPRRSALASLVRIAVDHALDPLFPAAVHEEVEALLRAGTDAPAGTEDPSLADLTGVPFVTIDNADSRDLDQALHVERDGSGHRVRYALADAAYYVRPGTALFEEALSRGSSFYLPGWMVPMLPRALSEGIVSLNEGVLRRALVFDMRLDAHGRCTKTEIVRARIRSHKKLSYDGVQAYYDKPDGHPIEGTAYAPSLDALRIVGQRRIAEAVQRDVVHHRRRTVEVGLSGARSFVMYSGLRNDVERYNEQLSLLCNVEGAELLRGGREETQAIYRVHPSPPEERVQSFQKQVGAIVEIHELPDTWRWDRGEVSLASYLAELPHDSPVSAAIQRQAIMMNVRSTFSEEAAGHHGVGADVYARFSSPMREIVGIFLHKELVELIGGDTASIEDDEATRAKVIEAANRSKNVQRRLTALGNLLALDQLFEVDRRMKQDARPVRHGTVMGLTNAKVYVSLDHPAIDVKLYKRDLQRSLETKLRLADDDLCLVSERGEVITRVGDRITLRVSHKESDRGHWVLSIVDA
ncbi:MAG: ribonuclease catalytic domain-containing protein [Sandaracinaceae bacterium]